MDDFENVRKAMEETRRRITHLQSPGFTENKNLEASAVSILWISAFAIAYILLVVIASWN